MSIMCDVHHTDWDGVGSLTFLHVLVQTGSWGSANGTVQFSTGTQDYCVSPMRALKDVMAPGENV